MSKLLVCEGYSDDTFGVNGPGINEDYDNCASGKPIAFRIASGNESLVVVGQYVAGGVWLVGVRPDDRHVDETIPAWPIRIMRGDSSYSPCLTVEAPDDVTVTRVQPKPKPEDDE